MEGDDGEEEVPPFTVRWGVVAVLGCELGEEVLT